MTHDTERPMSARHATPAAPSVTGSLAFPAYLATQAGWFFAFGSQTVVMPYLALTVLDLSGAAFGLVQSSLTAPSLALLLLAGVVAERVDRRRALILLHGLATLPPLALAITASQGALSMGALIGFALSMGVIGAFMMPARDAALNGVAAHAGTPLQRAVVATNLTQFLGQVCGMATAACIALLGMGTPVVLVLILQACALGLGGGAAFALPPSPQVPSRQSVRADLVHGLRVAWRTAPVRVMSITTIVVGLFVIGAGFFVLLPLLIVGERGGGLASLGAALIVFWLGAAAANGVLATRGHVAHPVRALARVYAGGAALFAPVLFAPPLALVYGLVFLWGAAAGLGIALSRSIVQDAAPPEALARVLSIYQFGFVGAAPLGALAGGVLAEMGGVAGAALAPLLGLSALAAWLAFGVDEAALLSSPRVAPR